MSNCKFSDKWPVTNQTRYYSSEVTTKHSLIVTWARLTFKYDVDAEEILIRDGHAYTMTTLA